MKRRRCGKKIRYHDRIAAMVALASCLHRDGSRRHKLEKRVYRCPACHGYHLTSS